MNSAQTAFIVVMMGVFCALARVVPARADRWIRLTISLPLLFSVLQPTILAGFFIAALAFIWCGPIAHLMTGPIMTALYGRGGQSAGPIPDFKFARAKIEDGKLQEAIKLAQWELTKNPTNYEGLILLAAIYQELKQPAKALAQVELIRQSADATDAQRDNARAAQTQLRELQIQLDEARRRA